MLFILYEAILGPLDDFSEAELEQRCTEIDNSCRVRDKQDIIVLRALLALANDPEYEKKFVIDRATTYLEISQNYEVDLVRFARLLLTLNEDNLVVLFRTIFATHDLHRSSDHFILIAERHKQLTNIPDTNSFFEYNSRYFSMCTIL